MSRGPAGAAPVTLQALLETADDRGPEGDDRDDAVAAPPAADPVARLRHLVASGRFSRDSGLGRMFHPGRISLRESVTSNSLHVVVEENRVGAHVDRVSPLGAPAGGRSRYSLRRAAAHNVVGAAQDLVGLLRGRQGDHRCELDCEWVWDESESPAEESPLLDEEAATGNVQLEARVAGSFDQERLRQAVRHCLGQPPGGDLLEVVSCDDDDDLDAVRARLHNRIIPFRHPPVAVGLAPHPAGDVLLLGLNHAAADGFAALGVLHAVARAYAGSSGPPLDFLALRDLPVRPAPATTSRVGRPWKGAVERLRDTLARPARLASDGAGERPGYGFHLVRLSVEETRQVVDVKPSGTSRNVLMAALHLAIGAWNLEHGTPGRLVHVLAPANLRPPEWQGEPVGNFSVNARVSTSRRERAGPASAFEAITAQTARNRRTRTGMALMAGLERAGLLPLWAKQSIVVLQPLTSNHLVDSALLCNLGWQDEAPSFGPELGEAVELWFSTPARSPMALCLGAVTVDGQLHLTFRHPYRLLSPEAARRFADCYLAHLRLVAARRP